jgi:predicted TIM-barrel fold metal-dependent hydrolase
MLQMMRIDAFNHFFPKKYFEKLLAAGLPDLGKRMAELPAVHDIDHRRKIVGSFRDYKQVISLAAPSLETLSKGDPDLAVEYARIGNDGMAELCQNYSDEFCGFVAQAPLTARDAGVAEAERAIKDLGACGAQIYTNVAGKPLDRPEFRPFLRQWKSSTNRSGRTPRALRTSPTTLMRRSPSTRSGGPSAGHTRRR